MLGTIEGADAFATIVAIERIERDAWLDIYAAAPPDLRAHGSIVSGRIGTSALLADRDTPGIVLNRAIGIGIEEPATEDLVAEAVAWMRLHANTNWALQIAPVIDPATMTFWAWRYKLKRARDALAKFHRGASPPVPARGLGQFDIREIERGAASDFAMIVERGYPVPPHVGQWLSALVGRPHWKTYLAYDGHVPIGCAAMFVRDGWAWLGVAATLFAYRGRGAQKALIARRISDGIAAGVAGFTVETGKPCPGQESDHPSYRNLLGAGFSMPYARAQYASFR